VGYAAVKVIGRGEFPQPAGDVEGAFLGKRDCRMVEFKGVVQQVGLSGQHPMLTLAWGLHTFKVHLMAPMDKAKLLLNRMVRVRGVCGALTNNGRQLLGAQLFVADLSLVHVESAPLPDPFRQQPVRGAELLQFSQDGGSGHAVHVRGTVTYPSETGPTWIRDSSGGIKIASHDKAALTAGDVVDVVGFPQPGGFGPVLSGAMIRRLYPGPPAAPVPISADDAALGNGDAQFVQLDGTVVDQSVRDGADELTLRAGTTVFSARLPEGQSFSEVQTGAVWRVTGICSVIVDNSRDLILPQGFRVLLRSTRDVRILKPAPWFTTRRLAATFSAMLLLAGAALVWVVLLRRTVRSQTRRLSNALARAREAESLEQDRKFLLELVARNEPLPDILSELARIAGSRRSETRCSIQLRLPDHPPLSILPGLPDSLAAELEALDLRKALKPPEAGMLEQLLGSTGAQHPNLYYSAAPIHSGQSTVGAILLFRPSHPECYPHEHDMLISWGALASLAVERSGLYEKLFFRAQYDVLTGLLNRASIYEKLDLELGKASGSGEGLGVLYLDIDNFKEINDAFGHDLGDLILRSVAQRIRQSVRRSDYAGRIGGDEFVVILPSLAGRREAERIGALVLSTLREPLATHSWQVRCEASLGISYYPEDADNVEDLIKAADHAMYREKRAHAASKEI
jgi:diguanylate cyclase (GGDEF)-like protein